MTDAPPGIDDLLDSGAAGLRFFVEFLPRAHRIGVASTVTVPHLTDRYDAQRGLDVARLAADADALRGLCAAVGSGVDEQCDRLAAVPAVWEGIASRSASEQLAAHAERSRRLRGTVDALTETLTGAAVAIGTIVDEKSSAAACFAEAVIGGLGPVEVDAVLAGASGAGTGPTVEQLARWSTGLPADADAAAVAQWCARWLNEVFGPGVETAVDAFAGLCDDADRAIGEVFDELDRAFGELDEQRFPGIGTDMPSGGGASRTRAEVAPAWGSPGASSADVVRAGASLVESGLELAAAVGELTGAIVELATAVVDGATAAVDGATAVVDGATAVVGAATGELPGSAAIPAEPEPEPHSGTAPPATESPAECEPEVAPADAAPTTGVTPPADTPRADPAAGEPRVSAPVPGSGGLGPAGVPGPVTGRGRSGRDAQERTGTVPATAPGPADPAEPGPADSAGSMPDGGVILPEAGPL